MAYELTVKHDPYLDIHVDSFILTAGAYCVFIDTGLFGQYDLVTEKMQGRSTAVLCTHGHWDHIGMHKTIQELGGIVRAHPGDRPYYEDFAWHWKELFGQFTQDCTVSLARAETFAKRVGHPVRPVYDIFDGESISMGDMAFDVIAIPGHSFGSVCYLEKNTGALFTGDGLIGRGFFNGTPQYIHKQKYIDSMEKLKTITCDTVYSCHNPPMNGRNLADKAQEGIDCCMRIDGVVRDYVRKHEKEDDLKLSEINQAIQDAEKRRTGAGTLVTILAHLESMENPPRCVQNCLSRYIHGI